jgi:hypothetical protein
MAAGTLQVGAPVKCCRRLHHRHDTDNFFALRMVEGYFRGGLCRWYALHERSDKAFFFMKMVFLQNECKSKQLS